jgi:hypothetical protein
MNMTKSRGVARLSILGCYGQGDWSLGHGWYEDRKYSLFQALMNFIGSLGAPRIGWLTTVGLQDRESSEMAFYDTKLSNVVENAFQALCLDDRRTSFAPAIWEKSEGNTTVSTTQQPSKELTDA